MENKKIHLCKSASSYPIEIDIKDLEVPESLAERYYRYVEKKPSRRRVAKPYRQRISESGIISVGEIDKLPTPKE